MFLKKLFLNDFKLNIYLKKKWKIYKVILKVDTF